MGCFQTGLAGKSAAGTAVDPVTRSLRFGSGAYLSRTFGTPTDAKKKTISVWVKRSKLNDSNGQELISYNDSNAGGSWQFSGAGGGGSSVNDDFTVNDRNATTGTADYMLRTKQLFRDPAAWYHIFIRFDTTISSPAADRCQIWVNGERVTDWNTGDLDYPDFNHVTTRIFAATTGNQYIGTSAWDTGGGFEGYLADFYFTDGTAYDVTDFAETDSTTGQWVPKTPTGLVYGNNGFHIDAQPAHDADLLVSSIDRNDGDTLFADAAKGHVVTKYGNTEHSIGVGNPFTGDDRAMFFDGSNDWIQVSTASTDFQFGTNDFTIEGWFNFAHLTGYQVICDLRPSNSADSTRPSFSTNGAGINMHFDGGNTSLASDGFVVGTWHHVAFVRASGSLKTYIDGVLKSTTSFTDDLNTSAIPHIGATDPSPSQEAFLSGYAYDFRITKGTAIYTSGFTAPSAAFELNPVYIGADQSGNKNHFQPTNIDSTDTREDNPFKNHATWNPLIKRSSTSNIFTYSEGNTVATYTGGVAHTSTTIASTRVHYAEFAFSGGTSSISGAGVVRARWNDGSADSYTTNYGGCYYGSSGNVDSPSGSTSVSAVGSDRLGIAFDGANNKADFYSVTSGGTMTLLKSLTSSDSIDFDGSATFTATSHDSGATTITGYFEEGEWYGTAPSVGSTTATALNTSNLDAPAVTPSEHFAAATYVGNNGDEEINLGFTPALTWIKNRDDNTTYHGLYDSVRGLSEGALHIQETGAEEGVQRVASFDSDTGSEGFTLSSSNFTYTNASGKDYISWNWKAHQTPPTPTNYSTTLTLTVTDHYGTQDYTGWGTTELEVFEGTQSLGTVGQPTGYNTSASEVQTVWEIKTNNSDHSKIKVVWKIVDTSTDGANSDRFFNINVVLTDSSSNELASWVASNYYGGGDNGGPDAPEAGDVFRAQTSSADESTTGVLEVQGPTVESNSEKYNAAAGFTMFTYTGNSSSDNDMMLFNHSLGFPIDFAIGKCRDAPASGTSGGKWVVWHKDLTNDDGSLYLNETESENNTDTNNYDEDNSTIGWFQNVTSGAQHQVKIRNVIIYDGNNYDTVRMVDSSKDFVFYGFTGVEGYSSFGKMVGNGDSSDGVFCYLGFRPALIIMKNITHSSGFHWRVWDSARGSHNVNDEVLYPSSSLPETTSDGHIDFLSNGFKLRSSAGNLSSDYIYAAWAESPFKHANAK